MDPDSSRSAPREPIGGARLRVSVSDGRGKRVRDGGLARWLQRMAPRSARGELAIAVVSDARMRVLNRTYRGRDCATDVLSFATLGGPPSRSPRARGRGSAALGDLVIAAGVAKRQAREAGHSYQAELRVLALHGLLHLLGYDHEDSNDNGRMQRAEARLRRKGGLKSGLIGRSAGRERPRAVPSTDR